MQQETSALRPCGFGAATGWRGASAWSWGMGRRLPGGILSFPDEDFSTITLGQPPGRIRALRSGRKESSFRRDGDYSLRLPDGTRTVGEIHQPTTLSVTFHLCESGLRLPLERVDCEATEAESEWLTGLVGLFRGLYGVGCGGASRVPGVMMTSPVDLRQTSYTRLGSRRM